MASEDADQAALGKAAQANSKARLPAGQSWWDGGETVGAYSVPAGEPD